GNLVYAVAEAVVGLELGPVLVRLDPEADHVGAPADRPELLELIGRPLRTLALDCLVEDPVSLEDVVVLERRRLVEDLVSRLPGSLLGRRHAPILPRAPTAKGH